MIEDQPQQEKSSKEVIESNENINKESKLDSPVHCEESGETEHFTGKEIIPLVDSENYQVHVEECKSQELDSEPAEEDFDEANGEKEDDKYNKVVHIKVDLSELADDKKKCTIMQDQNN